MPKASGYAKIDTKGRWFLRYKLPDGTDTRKILGYAHEADMPDFTVDRGEDFVAKDQAEAALEKILAPWRDWTDDSDPTFQQAAEEYLTSLRAKFRRDTTIGEYQRLIRWLLDRGFGILKLSEIQESPHINHLREATSPGCRNQTKTVLAGIVKVARKKHKYVGPDFSEWFDRAPVKRKLEIEVYTPAEVEKIASCAEPEIAAIIRVAAYTGLRMSELRALTWGDVDFAGEKITVRRRYTDTDGIQAPKSGKIRVVPMAKQVRETLMLHVTRSLIDSDKRYLVFGSGEDGYRSYAYISAQVARAVERAGVRHLRFHDLRHTFASTMIQRFPLPTVQEWCGHADIKTTARYLHWVPRKDDAAKMSDLLGGTDA